jgi:phospholipid transport system substrate-binding protein
MSVILARDFSRTRTTTPSLPATSRAASLSLKLILASAIFFCPLVNGGPAPEAEIFVRTHTESFQERLIKDEAANASDHGHLLATAQEIILPHFNFAAMSQRALGHFWRDCSTAQKTRFVIAFRTLLLNTYAGTVNDHRHDKITFLAPRKLSENVWRVRTEVVRTDGGKSFLIDYEVHREPDTWRVYDVTVEGVSLAVSYRAGLAKDISANGIDAVIAQIEERAATASR